MTARGSGKRDDRTVMGALRRHRWPVGVAIAALGLLVVEVLLQITLPKGAHRAGLPAQSAVDSVPIATYESFGLGLLREVASHDRGNVFLSPTSAGVALAMTATGARGQTRTEMTSVLGLGMTPVAAIGARNQALIRSLRSQHDVDLTMANALWARQDVSFASDFLQREQDAFGARVSAIDLASPAGMATINDWVRTNTNGKIPSILDIPPDPSTTLILTNAVYFKGAWLDRFDSAATKPGPFTTGSGSVVQRPMMARTDDYQYLRGQGFQGLRLPYRGDRFSMYILLPDARTGLGALYTALDSGTWQRELKAFAPARVAVVLPRFTIHYAVTLNQALQRLGMVTAFSADRADLSAMLPHQNTEPGTGGRGARVPRLVVSEVRQRTFVEVTENGTEAAAATSVKGLVGAERPQTIIDFIVDHPFIAIIRDDSTGALLFAGQIMDP